MTQRSKPRHYRPRRSVQQWAELMARYEHSGMSVAEFCAKEGVVLTPSIAGERNCAVSARLVLPRTAAAVAPFVELLSGRTAAGGFDIELELGHGVVLRMRGR